MRKRTSLVGLVASALLSGLVPATSAAQPAESACGAGAGRGAKRTTLYTFTVEAQPVKKTYRVGDKMQVAMTVTRPGREDPMDEGIPLDSPVHLPAEGVGVSASLYLGLYHHRYAMGITDENGEAILDVPPFPKGAHPGPVRAAVSARAFYNEGGCPDLEEAGYYGYDPFFEATK